MWLNFLKKKKEKMKWWNTAVQGILLEGQKGVEWEDHYNGDEMREVLCTEKKNMKIKNNLGT